MCVYALWQKYSMCTWAIVFGTNKIKMTLACLRKFLLRIKSENEQQEEAELLAALALTLYHRQRHQQRWRRHL